MALVPDIEIFEIDRSFIEPPAEDGPGIYIALFSNKGPDNKIVKGYSPSNIINTFGEPDVEKYGYGLYYAIKAAEFTPNVFIVRLLPQDATYSNIIVKFRSNIDTYTVSQDNLTQSQNINLNDVTGLNVGDKILIKVQEPNSSVLYYEYRTITAIDSDNNIITVDEPVIVYSGNEIYLVREPLVYSASGLTSADQINGELSLSIPVNEEVTEPVGFGFAIYPIGRGEYYNNIIIKFERNTDLERRYADEQTGKPLYPYNFWNIYVFEKNPETGVLTLLEDPITVSILETDNNGQPFRHPITGQKLFIEEQINNFSNIIRVVTAPVNSNYNGKKQIIPASLKAYFEKNNTDQFVLQNGYDGTLDDNTKTSLLLQAYNGTLNEDIEKITESSPLFKAYDIHYIPDPGYGLDVKGAILNLAQQRGDCTALLSLPYSNKHTNDINTRINILSQSTIYGLLDSGQYLTITDPFTGKKIPMPASYFRMVRILYNRQTYGIPTPPAGAKYGSITETVFEFSYIPKKSQAEDLLRYQINPIIKTPRGETYFVQELTMYKRYSILTRYYVVDTLVQFKKDIPELVRDLLMEKATDRIIKEAKERVSRYLNRWLEGGDPKQEALKQYSVNITFDETSLTLYIYITVRFLRTIEQIKIPIIVK